METEDLIINEPTNLNDHEEISTWSPISNGRIFENYLKARATSITVRELNKLSDRDLADLGMSRSEIISRAKAASNRE